MSKDNVQNTKGAGGGEAILTDSTVERLGYQAGDDEQIIQRQPGQDDGEGNEGAQGVDGNRGNDQIQRGQKHADRYDQPHLWMRTKNAVMS